MHVTTRVEWRVCDALPNYEPSAYSQEGFIHCCTQEQLQGVLTRYFKGKKGLLLLYIDKSKLEKPLIYEVSTNGELFPHIYGVINKDAVVNIEVIP